MLVAIYTSHCAWSARILLYNAAFHFMVSFLRIRKVSENNATILSITGCTVVYTLYIGTAAPSDKFDGLSLMIYFLTITIGQS